MKIDVIECTVHVHVCFRRDGCSPLHLACTWGLELVVQCLMEYNADVNTKVTEALCLCSSTCIPLH